MPVQTDNTFNLCVECGCFVSANSRRRKPGDKQKQLWSPLKMRFSQAVDATQYVALFGFGKATHGVVQLL